MLSRMDALSSTSAWFDSLTVVFILVSLKSIVYVVFIEVFIDVESFFYRLCLSEKRRSVPFLVF